MLFLNLTYSNNFTGHVFEQDTCQQKRKHCQGLHRLQKIQPFMKRFFTGKICSKSFNTGSIGLQVKTKSAITFCNSIQTLIYMHFWEAKCPLWCTNSEEDPIKPVAIHSFTQHLSGEANISSRAKVAAELVSYIFSMQVLWWWIG